MCWNGAPILMIGLEGLMQSIDNTLERIQANPVRPCLSALLVKLQLLQQKPEVACSAYSGSQLDTCDSDGGRKLLHASG